MKKYDALIIGFGKGGKTLAAALGKKGIKTAVIEKSPLMYGGTCINIGCIPTKKTQSILQLTLKKISRQINSEKK
mgnify:CR=1 FL=1